MMQKIVDMLSTALLLGSVIMSVPIAVCNPDGVAFVAWTILILLAGVWQMHRYRTDDGTLLDAF